MKLSCVGTEGGWGGSIRGVGVDFELVVDLDESEQKSLSKGEKITKNPKVSLIEQDLGQELNSLLDIDEQGYISLNRDQDLNYLELKLGLIEEIKKDARSVVGDSYTVSGAFKCKSDEILKKESEGNFYIWETDKVERGKVFLKREGTLKNTISVDKCVEDSEKRKVTCDLKVVTGE